MKQQTFNLYLYSYCNLHVDASFSLDIYNMTFQKYFLFWFKISPSLLEQILSYFEAAQEDPEFFSEIRFLETLVSQ